MHEKRKIKRMEEERRQFVFAIVKFFLVTYYMAELNS